MHVLSTRAQLAIGTALILLIASRFVNLRSTLLERR